MKTNTNAMSTTKRIMRAVNAILTTTANYSIDVPGFGLIGSYASIREAESALHYLPFSVRTRATICDADGVCVQR